MTGPSSCGDRGALGGTRTPNLLIRSYFTYSNNRLKVRDQLA